MFKAFNWKLLQDVTYLFCRLYGKGVQRPAMFWVETGTQYSAKTASKNNGFKSRTVGGRSLTVNHRTLTAGNYNNSYFEIYLFQLKLLCQWYGSLFFTLFISLFIRLFICSFAYSLIYLFIYFNSLSRYLLLSLFQLIYFLCFDHFYDKLSFKCRIVEYSKSNLFFLTRNSINSHGITTQQMRFKSLLIQSFSTFSFSF